MRAATVLCLLLAAGAQTMAHDARLFSSDHVLHARLEGPLQATLRNKQERMERSFVLRLDETAYSVKVRTRGNSRLRVCSFPPLRLNFNKADTAGTVFDGQDKLKLVTHCKRGNAAQADLLQEYAAYRVLNLISPISYRVRLLRLTYVEDKEAFDGQERFAFLIESQDALAARLNAQVFETKAISRRELELEHAAKVFVFQYLIGNTDWSMVTPQGKDRCCHNGDLVKAEDYVHYVPYDFDLAGIVDAKYAYPAPQLRIRKVTQRLYRGLCLSAEILSKAVQSVVAKQAQALALINDLPGLSRRDASRTAQYLQGFYEQAQDVDALLALFEKSCL